ncbi:right-handed parallel beta-helix repeat-containing protein [Candidatus Bathyarchaeota archaeon]|nr:right-handed parallel beta-helix repeat-containing protein [Candidatus Bathyarchaeota archaeon]
MKSSFSSLLIVTVLGLVLLQSLLVPTVNAVSPIYIRPDGSVEPSSSPLQKNGDVYTLTASINSDTDGITIQRANVVLNGAGYTLQGTGASNSYGIGLIMNNCTVKDLKIKGYAYGFWIQSSNNSIYKNEAKQNTLDGFNMRDGGSNNNITMNTIESNSRSGISMWYPTNAQNKIIANRIANNGQYGMWLSSASNNLIYHNNFTGNTQPVNLQNSPANIWDNGYPSGGNYWSSYSGVDTKHGPNQDITGSDNIGDNVYVLDTDNRDRYPLINPFIVPEFSSTLILLISLIAVSSAMTTSRMIIRPRR